MSSPRSLSSVPAASSDAAANECVPSRSFARGLRAAEALCLSCTVSALAGAAVEDTSSGEPPRSRNESQCVASVLCACSSRLHASGTAGRQRHPRRAAALKAPPLPQMPARDRSVPPVVSTCGRVHAPAPESSTRPGSRISCKRCQPNPQPASLRDTGSGIVRQFGGRREARVLARGVVWRDGKFVGDERCSSQHPRRCQPICMGASALTGRHALAAVGHASAGLAATHRGHSTGWEARDEPPNRESEATPLTSTLATPAAARELGRKYALRGRKSGSRNTGKRRINRPLRPGHSLLCPMPLAP